MYKQWKNRIIQGPNLSDLVERINRQGEDGWKTVSMTHDSTGGRPTYSFLLVRDKETEIEVRGLDK